MLYPSWMIIARKSHSGFLVIELLISLSCSCSAILFFRPRENKIWSFLSPCSCRLRQVEQIFAAYNSLNALVHKFGLVRLVSALSLAQQELLFLLRRILECLELHLTCRCHSSIHRRLWMPWNLTKIKRIWSCCLQCCNSGHNLVVALIIFPDSLLRLWSSTSKHSLSVRIVIRTLWSLFYWLTSFQTFFCRCPPIFEYKQVWVATNYIKI